MQQDSWNGKNLREMFRTGTSLLSSNSANVNALNVFPVPDGDTGAKMLLAMQSAMVEVNLYTGLHLMNQPRSPKEYRLFSNNHW